MNQPIKRSVPLAVVASMGSFYMAGIALAAANPSGTGRPNQECEEILNQGGRTPGRASSSPGSPFNPSGTGGQHYEAAGAPSQYDVACFQVSQR
jgi:hypothetical protein